MTKATKVENYTVEQEQILVNTYNPQATQAERDQQVKDLSEQFGKNNNRSVIAKLSRMDLYVKKAKVTKTGEPVIQKGAIVSDIAKFLGLAATALESLSKATKADLQELSNSLAVLPLVEEVETTPESEMES
jgi:hypothetical protein